jgi:uncharacterized protein (UPF0335 family)
MAKKLTKKTAQNRKPRGADRRAVDAEQDESRATTMGHNAKARRTMLREAHANLNKLEAKIEALNVQKRGLSKECADIYREIKSDLGIAREDLEAVRRLVGLGKDERDASITNLQEAFAALRPGEQLSFLSADEDRIDDALLKKARDSGYKAGKAGKNLDSHGYADEQRVAAFTEGYNEAQAEMAANLGGAPAGQA